MTPEGRVKADIKKFLTRIGAWYFMPATGGYGVSGVPDFVGSWKGRMFGIEAKRPGGKPTELQLRALANIRAAGGIALVCDDVSVLEKHFVDELLEAWQDEAGL